MFIVELFCLEHPLQLTDLSQRGSRIYFEVSSPPTSLSCHDSRLLGTFKRNYLPCLGHPSLVNVVNVSTLEFESVANTGKIGEEAYDVDLTEARDSTQASHLRSTERKRFLTL
ncbi:hypothetical protein AVEN_54036-1 [Araneus ventricosus]|uniref:Uncharacterized protein n=1 Tax=Araneus ventricosus TaxID=182803 RepID=A0A4Y2EGK5_ARAVE|nr:hypothetical protein AVEN_54036-1 [Araneus ventricosus]